MHGGLRGGKGGGRRGGEQACVGGYGVAMGGGGTSMYLKEVCKVLHADEVRKHGQAIQSWHEQGKPLLCSCRCQLKPCITIQPA